jgi:uncharacterized protein (TIGR02246 family)
MLGLLAIGAVAVGAACRHLGETAAMNLSGNRVADLRAIERLHEADKRAAMANDLDALIDLSAEDAILLPPGTAPVVGKEAIAAFLRQGWRREQTPEAIEYIHNFEDVTIAGEWAFECGTFKSVWREPGSDDVSTQSGNLLRVLRRRPDGSWKIARAMWNVREAEEPDNE